MTDRKYLSWPGLAALTSPQTQLQSEVKLAHVWQVNGVMPEAVASGACHPYLSHAVAPPEVTLSAFIVHHVDLVRYHTSDTQPQAHTQFQQHHQAPP
jgi:hypothetical protein